MVDDCATPLGQRNAGEQRGGIDNGTVWGVLPDCKRVREGRISLATGGYCQARQKLPGELVKTVSDELMERLREQLHEPIAGLDGPVLLLDRSSLLLEHCPELLQPYPPAPNQRELRTGRCCG